MSKITHFMKTYKLPYTIRNNFGEILHFQAIRAEGSKTFIDVTNEVQPGCGPVMHVHFKQDEYLRVVEGRMGYQIAGGAEQFAGPGESATFHAGQMHRFWNAGDDVLKCEGWISPPNNIIYYLENIYRLMDVGGGEPGGFEAAYLIRKYRSEFDVAAIPGFVKKVIFPIVVFFGKLAGKHRKFADAPPAVK